MDLASVDSQLMAAAKAYRNALLAMSSATAAFATAMEACSRVKGCRAANAGLAGASGLQHLIANHEQLLADTVYRQFEIPLLEALDHYKLITADRLVAYEKALHVQSGKIRKTEAENLKVGRRRKRDLQSFRLALAELQRQVDELDGMKAEYHEEVLQGEEEVGCTCDVFGLRSACSPAELGSRAWEGSFRGPQPARFLRKNSWQGKRSGPGAAGIHHPRPFRHLRTAERRGTNFQRPAAVSAVSYVELS